jgi:septal ring factor EnvC (AmiA/AmiB activator)
VGIPPLAQADPVLVGVVTALLGGGLASAIATAFRARKGAQLDAVQAAKILYDELRAELEDARAELAKAIARCSKLEDQRAALTDHLGDVAFRLTECHRELEEKNAEIADLRRE